MPATRRRRIGAWGERCAADFLIRQGYTILHTNVFLKIGEIDIVAKSPDGAVTFLEVKTRVDASPGEAERAIDFRKVDHLYRASKLFCLQKHIDLNYTSINFEYITIYLNALSKRATLKKYSLPFDYGYI